MARATREPTRPSTWRRTASGTARQAGLGSAPIRVGMAHYYHPAIAVVAPIS